MKISCIVSLSVCCFVTVSLAMEKKELSLSQKELSLSQLANTNLNNIAITNPMPGDLTVQRLTVKSFAEKFPEVIIADGQGNFDVNMQEFRTLCQSTAQALNHKEPVAVVQLKAASVGAEGMRLFGTLSGKGKVGAAVTAVGSIFIFGMIAGWFYTTKAHAAAGHGIVN